MYYNLKFALSLIAIGISTSVMADDFARLDEALPTNSDAVSIEPVFDFDTDSCLPSAAISRNGVQNGGLSPSGGLVSGCRNSAFLDYSNTYHRYACIQSNEDTYCAHFYALYFLKDQILNGIESGHRHDLEEVVIWTKNGTVTHGSYSAHGDLTTEAISDLDTDGNHIKFVYHKDGVLTHAMRFAKTDETAENPYGTFVTPTIVSWYTMAGDSVDNEALRYDLNTYDYGSAIVPIKDSNFLTNINEGKPDSYPTFTSDSVTSSN